MILVIGAGVAGLSCALAAADAGADVELVTPGALSTEGGGGGAPAGAFSDASGGPGEALAAARALAGGNTALAQGGIAAAIAPGDGAELHVADTLAAGVGVVDAEAVGVLAREGAAAMRRLIADGLAVDRGADGEPLFCLEAAHGMPRILHAGGDRSGAVLHAHLVSRVLPLVAAGRIRLREGRSVDSLIEHSGAVAGAVLRDAAGRLEAVRAEAVVLATGGYAALYPRTSNHVGARGEGIVLAARAGAAVADLEFVQFHPTVLAGTGLLISEAVRGAGALLRDGSGRRFMRDADPAAELAPRDVVSREIHRVLRARGEDAVWLDATGVEREGGAGTLARRFPGITAAVASQGLDWAREPVPVSPAAHYTMGGVLSDLDGRSTVPGLFVAGEASSTGVHGANRLASNSLLEGLVFGARAGRAAAAFSGPAAGARSSAARDAGREGLPVAPGAWEPLGRGFAELDRAALSGAVACRGPLPQAGLVTPVTEVVSRGVASGLGIERDGGGLHAAVAAFEGDGGAAAELATMIARAAEVREESRGAHRRADFPATDPIAARRRAFRFSFPADPGEAVRARRDADRAVRADRSEHSEHSEQRSLAPC